MPIGSGASGGDYKNHNGLRKQRSNMFNMCGFVSIIGIVLLLTKIRAESTEDVNVKLDNSPIRDDSDAENPKSSELFITTLNTLLGQHDPSLKDNFLFAKTTPNTLQVWKILNGSVLSTTPPYRIGERQEEVSTSTSKPTFASNFVPVFKRKKDVNIPRKLTTSSPPSDKKMNISPHIPRKQYTVKPYKRHSVIRSDQNIPRKLLQYTISKKTPEKHAHDKKPAKPSSKHTSKNTSKVKKRKPKKAKPSNPHKRMTPTKKTKPIAKPKTANDIQRTKPKYWNKNVQHIKVKSPPKKQKNTKNATIAKRSRVVSAKEKLLRTKIKQAQLRAKKKSKAKRSKPYQRHVKKKYAAKRKPKKKRSSNSCLRENIKKSAHRNKLNKLEDKMQLYLESWKPGGNMSVNNLVKRVFFDD